MKSDQLLLSMSNPRMMFNRESEQPDAQNMAKRSFFFFFFLHFLLPRSVLRLKNDYFASIYRAVMTMQRATLSHDDDMSHNVHINNIMNHLSGTSDRHRTYSNREKNC